MDFRDFLFEAVFFFWILLNFIQLQYFLGLYCAKKIILRVLLLFLDADKPLL